MSDPLADQVADLLAKQAIAEALADYARGADRLDVELIRSAFHPEAVADYGAMFRGTGYEFADFIAEVHPAMETHHHQLGQVRIVVDGDRAASEAYVVVTLRTRIDAATVSDRVSQGRYLDEWERRDGRWRISRRRYLHDLDEVRESRGGDFPVTGSRDRDDPSYEVLG